jgi:hypothetical protein
MGNNTSKDCVNNKTTSYINPDKKIFHILLETNNTFVNVSDIYINITFDTSTELFHYLDRSEIDGDFWHGCIPGTILGNDISIRAMLTIDNIEYPSKRISFGLNRITYDEVLLYVYYDEGHMISTDMFPYNIITENRQINISKIMNFDINEKAIMNYLKFRNKGNCNH